MTGIDIGWVAKTIATAVGAAFITLAKVVHLLWKKSEKTEKEHKEEQSQLRNKYDNLKDDTNALEVRIARQEGKIQLAENLITTVDETKELIEQTLDEIVKSNNNSIN